MKAINEINTRVYQTVFLVLILVSGVAIWISKESPYWGWIVLAVSIALEIGRSLYMRSKKKEDEEKRDMLFRLFFYGIRVIIIILLAIGLFGGIAIYVNSDCVACAVYQAVGLEVVILWTCVFLGYFLWALYFYNVNLGLTEEDWDKIKREKVKKNSGQFFSQDIIDEEPHGNPYREQTFGLPPGTVRGMIAFTLLFGAIALIIVSIGMKDTGEEGRVLRDQYEFFKNAFVMMIAFYFGSRSLELLTKKEDSGISGSGAGGISNTAGAGKLASSAAGGGTAAPADANAIKTGPLDTSGAQKPTAANQQIILEATPPASSDDVIVQFIDPMQKPI